MSCMVFFGATCLWCRHYMVATLVHPVQLAL